MRSLPRPALFLLVLALAWPRMLPGQAAPPPDTVPSTTFRVNTRLVVIHVIVTDKRGNPVSDLEPGDFLLLEDGKPQNIASVSVQGSQEASAARSGRGEGTVGNHPVAVPGQGPLTLLLLDALNSPELSRIYARDSMLDYLKKKGALGPTTAVLMLTTDLRLLQDFTADAVLLRAAIQRFGSATHRPPRTVTSNAGPGQADPDASDANLTADLSPTSSFVTSVVERMEAAQQDALAQQQEARTNSRVETTLAALRAIARYAAGYPGRKNLVWVSAGFPVSLIAPSPNGSSNPTATRNYADEIATTAALLSDAQVAVYPVNPGGIGGGYYSADEQNLNTQQRWVGLSALRELAGQTGGEAYLQRNDIGEAVSQGANDGARSYILAYYPANKNWDGRYRSVQVKVKQPGLHLRYRPGYYAVDFSQPPGTDAQKRRLQDLGAVLMGSVPSTMVLFDAKVTPRPGSPSAVTVDFTVSPQSIAFSPIPGGRQHCMLDFAAAAFSGEGKIVASRAVAFQADLKPEEYQAVTRQGLPFSLKFDIPPGRYLLRLAVRDEGNGYLGSTQSVLKVGDSAAGSADGK